MIRLLLTSLLLVLIVACGRRTASPEAVVVQGPAVFLPPIPPSRLQGDSLIRHMRSHYWDGFDFADTLFLSRADTMQLLDAYADYVARWVGPADPAPIRELMRRAAVSRPMLGYFRMLAERVLADPNSSLRNSELYIPVLEAVVASPWLDSLERMAPAYALKLAKQNRIGHLANDFRYTLASGRQGTLYEIHAEYTLIFFSNPGCPMCRQLHEEIGASPMLVELIEQGRLAVLALYLDEELAEWRDYVQQMPTSWINAYDKGCVIRAQGLYDTKAIPALYLLDRAKRVLLKDSTSVPTVEEIIDSRL